MKSSKFGMCGVMLGGIALILALVHFWAGSFSPQPTLETFVSEKAASIRQKTFDALKGTQVEKEYVKPEFNADKITDVTTAVLGALALILSALSFINHESGRASVSAAALGGSAIAFQFIAMYAMGVLVIVLIVAVLISLGAGG